MTAVVLQLRDYDRLRPVDGGMRGPADVIILPVVQVDRFVPKPPAAPSRSLIGGP